MVQMTPLQCRAHDYVHTSGVAFVRISTWEDDNDPFMNDQHGLIINRPTQWQVLGFLLDAKSYVDKTLAVSGYW